MVTNLQSGYRETGQRTATGLTRVLQESTGSETDARPTKSLVQALTMTGGICHTVKCKAHGNGEFTRNVGVQLRETSAFRLTLDDETQLLCLKGD